MKKLRYLFFLLIISIFVELFLRHMGFGDPITYISSQYKYYPKSNQQNNRYKGAHIKINRLGMRTNSNWDNYTNKNKIIFFGDSVTYGGSYIDDKETFAHLTCEYMMKTDYICANAGVNAYGIFNIVFRSRYDSRLINDDLRIFLLVPDDFYRGLQNYNTAHFYMKENNFLFPAIFEAINFISTKYNVRKYLSKNSDSKAKDNQYSLINESIEILNSEIKRLINNGKKVLIFSTNSKSNNPTNNLIIKKINDHLNYEIIDLSDILTEKMFEDETHFNKLGHKNIANFISKKIIEKLK